MKKQTLLILASACLLISACGGGKKTSSSSISQPVSSATSLPESSSKEEYSSVSSVTPSSESSSNRPSSSDAPSSKPSNSSSSEKPSSSSEKPSSSSSKESSSEKPSSSSAVEKFKVYFERGGEEVFATQEVEKGKCATNPGAPKTTDTKVFREWQDEEGNKFDFSTPINRDYHLNAYFVFVVSFDLNGGTGSAPASQDCKTYKNITLPECNATKSGYVFNGWLDGDDLYKAGSSYYVTKTIEFKASWVEDAPAFDGYQITYKPGDHGVGSPVTRKTSDDGSAVIEKSTLFTAETGYVFSCWAKENDLSTTYRSGDSVIFSSATTLVAQWVEQVEYLVYTNDDNGYLYFANTHDGTYASGGELSYDDIFLEFGYSVANKVATFAIQGTTYTVDVSTNGECDPMTITYNGRSLYFGGSTEATMPVVIFSANGGSGVAPTVDIQADGTTGRYKFKFPQNTYTPPSGMKFEAWYIDGYKYSVNSTYYCYSGETINISAGWIEATDYVIVNGVLTNWYINEKDVVIPASLGVTSVAANAFKNMNLIETIDFADTVKSIASGVFSNLAKLTSITLRSTTEVNAQSCFFSMTGAKITVYVPSSLLTWDSDEECYVYGSGVMGTQMFIFLPIPEVPVEDANGFIRHNSFADICGTYKDPDCMVSTANYHTAQIYYDDNFEAYVIKFTYNGSLTNRTITFSDNFGYEATSNTIYADRSTGGWAKFGIKANGNLYLIELATSSSKVYSGLVNEFVKE